MGDGAAIAWTIAAALFGLLTALLTILSALLERSGPIRLRHWADEAGGHLRLLYESPPRFEVFRFLVSWLARLVPLAFFGLLAVPMAWSGWLSWMGEAGEVALPVATAVVVVALVLAAAEMVNRALVRRDPERALRQFTAVYRFVFMLLMPAVFLLAPLFPARLVERRGDEDEVTGDEIEAFINVGTQEGILEPGEEHLIQGVIDFGDTLVRSVMTPRIDMVCAPVESALEELAETFLQSKHSRIPIYRDSVDQIVGVLHIRDLLRGLRTGGSAGLVELVMPCSIVPVTKRLDEMLREFQAQRQQLAIVVDEFGGTAGLVTIEDLIEEIVGEIEDEHDETAGPLHQSLPDGIWRVDGRAPIDVLGELFDVDLDDEPYETVGGLIFDRLGALPEAGAVVESHGLRLEVERVGNRSVRSVLARPLPHEGHDG